jgi:hypothetical protein
MKITLLAFLLQLALTPHLQPQCGIYLLFISLTCLICRFVDWQPKETARIAAAGSLGPVKINQLLLLFSL